MADYRKMYAVLCGAIDDVLDDLQTIPLAQPYARQLHSALLTAEDIYVDTEAYAAETEKTRIIQSQRSQCPEK